MKLACVYDHHHAVAEWEKRELHEWITDVYENDEASMIKKLICFLWGHRLVHKAYTGNCVTLERLDSQRRDDNER